MGGFNVITRTAGRREHWGEKEIAQRREAAETIRDMHERQAETKANDNFRQTGEQISFYQIRRS